VTGQFELLIVVDALVAQDEDTMAHDGVVDGRGVGLGDPRLRSMPLSTAPKPR
jgi:hypothetical protein